MPEKHQTKAEVVAVLQDGVARIEAIEAEKDNVPIVVQPNTETPRDMESRVDALQELKDARKALNEELTTQ